MDEHTKQNWQKVKEALEAAGKTDSLFYRRAISIIHTGHDPLDSFLNNNDSTRN
jgi:hypothetical protein